MCFSGCKTGPLSKEDISCTFLILNFPISWYQKNPINKWAYAFMKFWIIWTTTPHHTLGDCRHMHVDGGLTVFCLLKFRRKEYDSWNRLLWHALLKYALSVDELIIYSYCYLPDIKTEYWQINIIMHFHKVNINLSYLRCTGGYNFSF